MNDKRVASQGALAGATFRKSSHSTAAGNCVEVAGLPSGHRAVRDSKELTGPVLMFTPAAWAAFTTGVRTGELS